VEESLPGRALNIRPGLIVGPHDPTDRFTYWPWRVSQGGDILAPGRPEHGTQFIDVRDLADWTIRMVEAEAMGIFNATGPQTPMTMGTLLEASREASGLTRDEARLHWVSEAFLLENKVEPWSELPLYLPDSDPAYAGMDKVSIEKALRAGLIFRSLEDTLRATLDWVKTRPADHEWKAGLTMEREADLLRRASEAGAIK
jgi:2'-hydroxyisoflavone reductase